ncbi:prepilin-type N-terminal cleavage/methylation domain-containing protein [Neptunomonas sp.]|uniref:type II secretion system protein n=1 Tax=Neptunomonas sp. TaxID=1971898 RepID=UPI0025F59E00|nr:prepilin-type N-terminal cleavage/methylation domain-containing protein [Neptunomonas sp.]
MNTRKNTQAGFTLIELLVVISVLAAMAGIAVTAIDSYDGEARDQLARVEMNNIANAVYRFKQDTGYFPQEGVFNSTDSVAHDSNFDFLFSSPQSSNVDILPWQADVARGWNGPYLTTTSQQRLHFAEGAPLSSDCDLVSVDMTSTFIALEDTYERAREYSNTDNCFAIHNKGQWVPRAAAGMPYQYRLDYFEAGNPDCPAVTDNCIALISAGKDSIYNNGDDLVTILRKNG